ncbi:MAG: PIG-L family deacetylase [Roseiflexaceae bacterium]|nr:PIG-L family deacetylase [Roseiflexaceae bacterium]
MANVLVISAHPDDETMAMGGTIAMHVQQGDLVYLVETTRGEGGEVGEPPLTSRAQLGPFREGELREAARALGVTGLVFLPFVDPHMEIGGTAQQVDATPEAFTAAIRAEIERLQPDIIYTHGSNGEYGHPQHVFTHESVRRALAESGLRPELYTWGAWYEPAERPDMLNKNDIAQTVRDVTPWFAQKLAAVMAHRTQHTMFLRNSGAASVADMVSKTESFKRVLEE